MFSFLRFAGVVCGVLLAATPSGAAAQGFAATNVQLLYGDGFDDWYTGNSTAEGRLLTVTFEQLTVFRGGDAFFFADLTHGTFATAEGRETGVENQLYAELHLRISPLQLAGVAPQGFVRDVLVAGELNRGGGGFAANLIGAGIDFRVPGFSVAQLNVYYRDDTFNEGTYQVTGVWGLPFNLGGLRGSLEGFADLSGTDHDGMDLLTQPQLLLRPFAPPVHVGAELYVHTNDAVSTVAPQLLVKWYL
jgi:hypothetical protein